MFTASFTRVLPKSVLVGTRKSLHALALKPVLNRAVKSQRSKVVNFQKNQKKRNVCRSEVVKAGNSMFPKVGFFAGIVYFFADEEFNKPKRNEIEFAQDMICSVVTWTIIGICWQITLPVLSICHIWRATHKVKKDANVLEM